MELAGYFIIAIILLIFLVKIFAWPLKIVGKLILNGLLGVMLLLLVNFVGKHFNFYININIATSLIAGLLGVPGVIFLIIFNKYL